MRSFFWCFKQAHITNLPPHLTTITHPTTSTTLIIIVGWKAGEIESVYDEIIVNKGKWFESQNQKPELLLCCCCEDIIWVDWSISSWVGILLGGCCCLSPLDFLDEEDKDGMVWSDLRNLSLCFSNSTALSSKIQQQPTNNQTISIITKYYKPSSWSK